MNTLFHSQSCMPATISFIALCLHLAYKHRRTMQHIQTSWLKQGNTHYTSWNTILITPTYIHLCMWLSLAQPYNHALCMLCLHSRHSDCVHEILLEYCRQVNTRETFTQWLNICSYSTSLRHERHSVWHCQSHNTKTFLVAVCTLVMYDDKLA